jgi:hypothetical protein
MEDFAMDRAGGSEGRVVRGMKKSRRVANEETGDGQGKGAASNGSSQEGEVDVGVLLGMTSTRHVASGSKVLFG